MFIQYNPKSPTSDKHTLCSKTGKKLVVMIDNFNLINTDSALFEFLHTAISHQYYYDFSRNRKITIGDVCFICSKTGSFQSINYENPFLLRHFFPIYVNEPELVDIMGVYGKNMTRIEGLVKSEAI